MISSPYLNATSSQLSGVFLGEKLQASAFATKGRSWKSNKRRWSYNSLRLVFAFFHAVSSAARVLYCLSYFTADKRSGSGIYCIYKPSEADYTKKSRPWPVCMLTARQTCPSVPVKKFACIKSWLQWVTKKCLLRLRSREYTHTHNWQHSQFTQVDQTLEHATCENSQFVFFQTSVMFTTEKDEFLKRKGWDKLPN